MFWDQIALIHLKFELKATIFHFYHIIFFSKIKVSANTLSLHSCLSFSLFSSLNLLSMLQPPPAVVPVGSFIFLMQILPDFSFSVSDLT